MHQKGGVRNRHLMVPLGNWFPSWHLGVMVVVFVLSSAAHARAADTVQLSDDPVRAFAEKTVLPKYPASAIRMHHTGVAVAAVHLDENGHIQRVDVLEAPSLAIGAAVREAVLQWRFRSPRAQSKTLNLSGKELVGKVTFYFFQSKGRYQVAGPNEAPNIRALDQMVGLH